MKISRYLIATVDALSIALLMQPIAIAQPLQGTVSQEDSLSPPAHNFRLPRPTAQPEDSAPLYQGNIQQSEGQQSASLNYQQPDYNQSSSVSPQFNGNASQWQSSVEQEAQPDDHGEAHMGVLGGPYNLMTGVIRQVLPGSDLNRFGIHPGDRYLGINGHRFNGFTFVKECHGTPGSVIYLVILHDGQVVNIAVRRMDGRIANQQNRGLWGNNYRWEAAQNQYW